MTRVTLSVAPRRAGETSFRLTSSVTRASPSRQKFSGVFASRARRGRSARPDERRPGRAPRVRSRGVQRVAQVRRAGMDRSECFDASATARARRNGALGSSLKGPYFPAIEWNVMAQIG